MSGYKIKLGAKSGNNRNKKSFFESAPNRQQKQKQQPGNQEIKIFDANPLIVTRRNISTAQVRKREEQEDQEDLIYSSGWLKRKENQNQHLTKSVKQSLKTSQQRPQSKQEQKRRSWNEEQIIKLKRTNTQAQSERPQTSKGVRKKISQISKVESCKSEGKSIEIAKTKLKNEQIVQQLTNKGKTQSNKLFFKTVIDSEFLSLFAK